MARASWKFHFFQLTEVEHYANYLTDDLKPEYPMVNRRTTLTKLNYFIPAVLYTGKWSVEKNFTRYHVGFKLGQFTKTRKPFYFRSKKKKNVTKKNHVSLTIKYTAGQYTDAPHRALQSWFATANRLFSFFRHVTINENVTPY